jgi:hypothetical protein
MAGQPAATGAAPLETDLPLRLDRLPWARFHWLVVVALGITWILDGLEVTIVSAVASVLEAPDTLGLSSSQVGAAATAYLAGTIAGSLCSAISPIATGASGCSW